MKNCVKTVYGEIVPSTGLLTSPDHDFDGFSNITGSSFSVDFE